MGTASRQVWSTKRSPIRTPPPAKPASVWPSTSACLPTEHGPLQFFQKPMVSAPARRGRVVHGERLGLARLDREVHAQDAVVHVRVDGRAVGRDEAVGDEA